MGGSLTYAELQEASRNDAHQNIKYFVETGTYRCETTLLAAKHYEHVYTTEIHEGLHNESKQRAEREGVSNITFLLGDSTKLLSSITEKVKEGAVFFIDAHISGADSGWNGVHRVPIYEELEQILPHKVGPSVFIFDDLRLWKSGTWDWAHITSTGIVQKFLLAGYRVLSAYEKNDRFFVLTG